MTQFLYIGIVYGKVKPGISGKLSSRIKSYDKGNNNPVFHEVYVAKEGYDEHVVNCERYVNRQLFPYLENPQGNRTPSEYVDPQYSHIDTIYVKKIVEDRVKSHPLQMYRLKKTFLPITRYNAKTIEEGIKHFPDKYLEKVK
jgi:hypothetical protein